MLWNERDTKLPPSLLGVGPTPPRCLWNSAVCSTYRGLQKEIGTFTGAVRMELPYRLGEVGAKRRGTRTGYQARRPCSGALVSGISSAFWARLHIFEYKSQAR